MEERQENPKSALYLIANAIDLYKVDLEENPKSLNDLYVNQYLNLDAYPFDDPKWSYSFTIPEQIIAQPTQINPITETKPLILDWNTRELQFDSIQDSLYKVPFVQWDYLLDIQSISQLFSSKLEIDLSPDKTAFDLLLKRGQFKLDHISFTSTPGDQLTNRSQVFLPSLNLETNNFEFLKILFRNITIIKFTFSNLSAKSYTFHRHS